MASSVDLVNGAYAAFAKGDIPGLLESLSDDVDWSSPGVLPQGGDFSGKDGALKFFQNIGASWDSLSLEVEGVADTGDGLVLAVVSASGTRKGGGGAAGYGAAHAFNVRDGKIVRFREYVDLDAPLGG
jgi:ketosteroid isomerase-like protein